MPNPAALLGARVRASWEVTVETIITREHIAAEIANLRAKQRRMPAHWVKRREQVGAEIDALVEEWLAVDG